MNHHINNFKNRIIVVLALLPSLIIAQEIETKVFGFGPTVMEIQGQPDVSEKSNSNEKNTMFYEVDITINYPKLHPDQAVTQTNINAEKAEMLLMDNKGRPLAIVLHNATIENNIMSSFAKEALISSNASTITFLTDKVDVLSVEDKEVGILNNHNKDLWGQVTKTYSCQGGTIHKNGKDTGNTSETTCSGGTEIIITCSNGGMQTTTTTNSLNCII